MALRISFFPGILLATYIRVIVFIIMKELALKLYLQVVDIRVAIAVYQGFYVCITYILIIYL